jgi:hypothetical protein
MEQPAGKFNCRAVMAGLLNDKFKGIAVAPDAAGVEMSANDQCRRIGEPREQFAPRRAG